MRQDFVLWTLILLFRQSISSSFRLATSPARSPTVAMSRAMARLRRPIVLFTSKEERKVKICSSVRYLGMLDRLQLGTVGTAFSRGIYILPVSLKNRKKALMEVQYSLTVLGLYRIAMLVTDASTSLTVIVWKANFPSV